MIVPVRTSRWSSMVISYFYVEIFTEVWVPQQMFSVRVSEKTFGGKGFNGDRHTKNKNR